VNYCKMEGHLLLSSSDKLSVDWLMIKNENKLSQ